MKRKRKKCSDQDKAGEVNKRFQSLISIPPVFLIFVSRNVFLEWLIDLAVHFGAKRSQNVEKFELENGRKAELLNFWSFHLYLSVVRTSRNPSLPGSKFPMNNSRLSNETAATNVHFYQMSGREQLRTTCLKL